MMRTIKIRNTEIFIKCSSILIFLFCCSETAFTQTKYDSWYPIPNKDFEIWTRATVEKKVRKKTFLILSPKARFNNNSAVLKSLLSDFSLYYRYNKNIRFSFGYRITLGSSILYHRFYGQCYYKNEIFNNLKFTYRGRLEREITERKFPDHVFRNKVVVDYDFSKKVDLFIASEIIYKIHYKENYFNKIRFDVGFVVDIGKRKELNLFYRYQKELNEKNPLQSNIIGINYAYSFK